MRFLYLDPLFLPVLKPKHNDEADELASPSPEPTGPKKRAAKKGFAEKVSQALSLLSGLRISPFELISLLLDGDYDMYRSYRTELYKDSNTRLSIILDSIASSKAGSNKLRAWLRGSVGAFVVGSIIHDEMDVLVSKHRLKGVAEINPAYIENRSPPVFADDAPFTMELLCTAAQTSRSAGKNTKKTPDIVSSTTSTCSGSELN